MEQNYGLQLYDDKRINTAISFIEPIIIGILAVIIGAVLLAVMLPMTNIMTAVG